MKKKGILIGVAVAVVVLVGGYLLVVGWGNDNKEVTSDNLPIWLLRDGEVAVYQEVTLSEGKFEKKVVVDNLSDKSQEGMQIYVSIPKEIAKSASELTFSEDVEIIEDDPLVLWSIDDSDDSSIFSPFMSIAKSVYVNFATDICETEDAKKYMEKNSWAVTPGTYLACTHYMWELERRVQERTKDEWQSKTDHDAVVRTVEKGDAEYEAMKNNAKQILKQRRRAEEKEKKQQKGVSGPKISREEAVALIREKFGAAKGKECVASFNNSDNGWRVICSRLNYKDSPTSNYLHVFNYKFFFVSPDGTHWTSKGEYAKSNYNGKVEYFGAPQWGIIDE